MLIQITEPSNANNNDSTSDNDEVAIGIDLGTTNSLVAYSENQEPSVVPNEEGKEILPSIIYFNQESNLTTKHPQSPEGFNHVISIKRLIGRSAADLNEDDNKLYSDLIDCENSDRVINLKLGKKSFSPIELSAEILKELKNTAEKSLNKKVSKSVITVPAYFNDAQRQATKDAAKIAKLEVLRLVNEPTAAALAYGLDNQAEGIYAVYDFGGGTFDVSILKMQMGVFKVVATGGNTTLGGDDLDLAIAELIKTKAAEKSLKIDKLGYHKLKKASKDLKHGLADNESVEIKFLDTTLQFTKEEISKVTTPIINRTVSIFESVIEDSEIDEEDIKGIIMVGGSTRFSLVKEVISSNFDIKIIDDLDPDKVVALGAAIQAESLFSGSNNLLLDVTPLSLGLETYGGLMEVVIPRNTPIPITKSQKFTTYEDGQTSIKVQVLQGEREMAENCRSLAEFHFTNIPPKPSGTAVVEINFTVDADGLLKVSAQEETTGITQEVEVKPSYGLTSKEMEKILFSSMETAKADITKKLHAEAKVEADISLKNISKAISTDSNLINAEYLNKIEMQIENVKKACEGTDRELIDYEVHKLDEVATDFADARVSNELKNYLSGKKVEEVK